eukprot:CAMPEP_0170554054 /NCGR_PEP_ID=MMETSP0211-20121228/11925_1 /TAXON_ID=311385 /ORGANISM="Pseudokeronopsis sp., Strain OXSARD2" /LENGTH=47 /DNA_ID= /DNA_START= /DNA_END= /DNA_ORIENTATION=
MDKVAYDLKVKNLMNDLLQEKIRLEEEFQMEKKMFKEELRINEVIKG